jgi:hypothetical protein
MYFPRKRRRTSLIQDFSNLNFYFCVTSSRVAKALHLSHRNGLTLFAFGGWEGWERYGGKEVNIRPKTPASRLLSLRPPFDDLKICEVCNTL